MDENDGQGINQEESLSGAHEVDTPTEAGEISYTPPPQSHKKLIWCIVIGLFVILIVSVGAYLFLQPDTEPLEFAESMSKSEPQKDLILSGEKYRTFVHHSYEDIDDVSGGSGVSFKEDVVIKSGGVVITVPNNWFVAGRLMFGHAYWTCIIPEDCPTYFQLNEAGPYDDFSLREQMEGIIEYENLKGMIEIEDLDLIDDATTKLLIFDNPWIKGTKIYTYYIFFDLPTESGNYVEALKLETASREAEKLLSTLKIYDKDADKDMRDMARISKLHNPIKGLSLNLDGTPISMTYEELENSELYDAVSLHKIRENGEDRVDGYHFGVNIENPENPLLLVDDCDTNGNVPCPSVDGYGSSYFSGNDNLGCNGEDGLHCLDITCILVPIDNPQAKYRRDCTLDSGDLANPQSKIVLYSDEWVAIIKERKAHELKVKTELLEQPSNLMERDQERLNNIGHYQVGVEIYYDDTFRYPEKLSQIIPKFLSETLLDPLDKATYAYTVSVDGQHYHLGVSLEIEDNIKLNQDADCNSMTGSNCYSSNYIQSNAFDGSDSRGCKGEKDRYCYDVTDR